MIERILVQIHRQLIDSNQPNAANLAQSKRPGRTDEMPFTVPVSEPALWSMNFKPLTSHQHLTGNVWEWCQDWFEDYPGQTLTNPVGAATGTVRIVRGGSFRTREESAWSAFSGIATPDTMTTDIGFRVARSVH